MLRRALLPVLALVLVLLPAPARAATPGVNVIGALGNNALVQRALDTGAGEVRFFVDWGSFEASGPKDINSPAPDNLRDGTFAAIKKVKDAGRDVLVVITGAPAWANGGNDDVHPPTAAHVGDYARFAAAFVRRAKTLGAPIDTIEVWNEPEGGEFWKPAPDPALYTSLLRATYLAVKNPLTGVPATDVFAGPTTGNNYVWLQQLYDNGARGSFDGVSVHTDTACLVAPPDSFYREGGRLARYTFLGYREVRATMLANGDDKPIIMSEVGWSSTSGGPTSCARGTFAGQKANGVTPEVQARNLTRAFACLANDPYVRSADWFQLTDTGTASSDEMGHYGLYDTGFGAKPALAAFRDVASAGGGAAGECGDFTPPTITVHRPRPGEQFVGKLDIRASAKDDGVGLARISFFVDDKADEIRNFTTSLLNGTPVGLLPWQGSGVLGLGRHTIKVVALDKNGNQSSQDVAVEKVTTLAATLQPSFALAKRALRCRGRSCTLRGTLSRGNPDNPTVTGKVAVEWQVRSGSRWRKLVGGLKGAEKPFAFTARLRKPGRWRVRVTYRSVAPYRSAASRWTTFRVR